MSWAQWWQIEPDVPQRGGKQRESSSVNHGLWSEQCRATFLVHRRAVFPRLAWLTLLLKGWPPVCPHALDFFATLSPQQRKEARDKAMFSSWPDLRLSLEFSIKFKLSPCPASETTSQSLSQSSLFLKQHKSLGGGRWWKEREKERINMWENGYWIIIYLQ